MDQNSAPHAVALWKRIAASGDVNLIDDLISDEVIFESPVLHTPQVGRALVKRYLAAAVHTLGGPESRFTNQWLAHRSAVLELEAEVGGLTVNAVDIFHWNEADQVTRFKVMVRPLSAIHALAQAMTEAIGGR